MQLTSRDEQIIHFINEFGFCEMNHISRRFDLNTPRNYQVMNRLIKNGLLAHDRIFYAKPGVYYVTQKGAKLTNLPSLHRLPISVYEHHLKVIDVFLFLQDKYPDTTWISERRLKNDKIAEGFGKSGHICDGILILNDGKQIAVEVELSLKGEKRLRQILKGYSLQFAFKEVWYFCSAFVLPKVKKASEKLPFIKVFSIDSLKP